MDGRRRRIEKFPGTDREQMINMTGIANYVIDGFLFLVHFFGGYGIIINSL